ncbi:hypothetical protein Fcan01_21978 [Folsomia candida]|uniref:Uncharacterized protein n=1 Tax=Folsomia candida TaxID=158441 RepID=A0A226DFG9_FOLCA|nr:hypothetical protein Fcan01_21978 [Folsomia candida]
MIGTALNQRNSIIMGLLLMLLKSGVLIKGDSSPMDSQAHVKLEITDYFIPFGNCTVIAFIPNNATHFLRQKGQHAPPIILYSLNLMQGEIIDHRFSIVARRNPFPHCWTTFLILPETQDNFKLDKKYLDATSEPSFISPYWPNQYFILITTIKNDIQKSFKRLKYAEMYKHGIRDVSIISVRVSKNELINSNGPARRIYYKNQYSMDTAIVGADSTQWYMIDCLPKDCFHSIELVAGNASMQNKYISTALVKIQDKFTTSNCHIQVYG